MIYKYILTPSIVYSRLVRQSVSLRIYTNYGFLATSKPQKYFINKPNGMQFYKKSSYRHTSIDLIPWLDDITGVLPSCSVYIYIYTHIYTQTFHQERKCQKLSWHSHSKPNTHTFDFTMSDYIPHYCLTNMLFGLRLLQWSLFKILAEL